MPDNRAVSSLQGITHILDIYFHILLAVNKRTNTVPTPCANKFEK